MVAIIVAVAREFGDGRHVKGVNLLGLVKTIKVLRRQRPIDGLSPETLALLEERVLVSSWYPLQHLWELLDVTYRELLGSEPARALEIGVMGGMEVWSGTHRVFVVERGPISVLRSMGPAWSSYFDFGSLDVTLVDERCVRFTVRDYPDVPVPHGMTIAGWHLAAARVAGCPEASAEVVEAPWEGAADQVHLVHL